MTADRLLRLYPRAWRQRYGAEFIDTVGDRPLRAQQVIDIVMGASDARMSAAVRRSSSPMAAASSGGAMLNILKASCASPKVRVSTTDSLISAGVLIATSILLVVLGTYLTRSGQPVWGKAIMSIAFPISCVVSMPFGLLKGQPWRAQALVLGVTTTLLLVATYVATLI